MQKLNKFFLIGVTALLILSLALPQSAWASLIPGPFDYFDMVAQHTEEVAGPIMGKVLAVFVFYVAGLIALNATASILDAVILAQPTWLDLQTPMVQEGWHFTAGLANMLIILILIFIAFQIILKIDTVATKKMLIRLFIVALLINFSLVFIEVALDVVDVFYKSILTSVKSTPSSDSLFGAVIDVLTGGTSRVVRNFTVMLGGWLVTFLIPGAGAIREFIIGTVFVAIYLPMIIGWAIESVLFFLLSGVFLIFSFVFVARVYILQFLAILSPLAFISLILPQTQKYWKMWLDHLVEWILVGIFLLFFLALWCAGIQGLVPAELSDPWMGAIPSVGWAGIKATMIFYFLTIVYFAILLFVSRKAVPAITQEIMTLAKNVGATVWSAGVRPVVGSIGRQAGKAVTESPRARGWAERQATAETPALTGWKRILGPAVATGYMFRRKLGRALGPEAQKADIAEAEGEAEKIQDPELLLSKFLSATGNLAEQMGYLSKAIEKGGAFKEKIVEKINVEDAIRLAKAANNIGAIPQAKRIARAFATKENLAESPDLVKRMGFKELTDKEQKMGYTTVLQKLIAEAKGDEIKNFSEDFWQSPEAMEAVQRFWGGSQLGRAADEFGKGFIDDYMKVVKKSTPEQNARINPRAMLYLSGNSAQDLGYESVGGLGRKDVAQILEKGSTQEEREREIPILRTKIREVFPETIIARPPSGRRPGSSRHRPSSLGETGPHSV